MSSRVLEEACRRLRVRRDTGASAVAFGPGGSGFGGRTLVNGGRGIVQWESSVPWRLGPLDAVYMVCVGHVERSPLLWSRTVCVQPCWDNVMYL